MACLIDAEDVMWMQWWTRLVQVRLELGPRDVVEGT